MSYTMCYRNDSRAVWSKQSCLALLDKMVLHLEEKQNKKKRR